MSSKKEDLESTIGTFGHIKNFVKRTVMATSMLALSLTYTGCDNSSGPGPDPTSVVVSGNYVDNAGDAISGAIVDINGTKGTTNSAGHFSRTYTTAPGNLTFTFTKDNTSDKIVSRNVSATTNIGPVTGNIGITKSRSTVNASTPETTPYTDNLNSQFSSDDQPVYSANSPFQITGSTLTVPAGVSHSGWVKATDANDSALQDSILYNVTATAVAQIPTFNLASNQTGTEGNSISTNLESGANDLQDPKSSLVYSYAQNPDLNVDIQNGVSSVTTVNPDAFGSFPVTYTVTDTDNNSAQQTVNYTYNNDNADPVVFAGHIDDVTADIGQTKLIDVNGMFSDADGTNIEHSLPCIPDDKQTYANGVFSVTLDAPQSIDNCSVEGTDFDTGDVTKSNVFSYTVSADTTPPTLSLTELTMDEDSQIVPDFAPHLRDNISLPENINLEYIGDFNNTGINVQVFSDKTVQITPLTNLYTLDNTSITLPFRLTDEAGNITDADLELKINNVYDAIVLNRTLSDWTVNEGDSAFVAVDRGITNLDNAVLSYSISNVNEINTRFENGGYWFAPVDENQNGDYGPWIVTVDDGVNTFDYNGVSGKILSVNDWPMWTNSLDKCSTGNIDFVVNTTYEIADFSDCWSDPDNAKDELTLAWGGNGPINVTYDSLNDKLTFESSWVGRKSITFAIADPENDKDVHVYLVNVTQ